MGLRFSIFNFFLVSLPPEESPALFFSFQGEGVILEAFWYRGDNASSQRRHHNHNQMGGRDNACWVHAAR